MEYRETDSIGSFRAWGTGFNYEYNASSLTLTIIHARKEKPLVRIDFDGALSEDALGYVHTFEKSTQIKALMFSNNRTVNLSETFDDLRLVAIMTGTANLTRYAFDLQKEDFKRFEKHFCRDFDVRAIQVTRISGRLPAQDFFSAKLSTKNRNSVNARSSTLSDLLLKLSDKILHDLITLEFSHHYQSAAHTLLRTSSQLTTLSLILNGKFSPPEKISKKEVFLHDGEARIQS